MVVDSGFEPADGAEAALPLRNLKVVEFGTSVAGPIASQILAELGAEVIKIENPDGGDDARIWGPPFLDGVPPVFLALNRNKKSAAINLKDQDERDALRQYILAEVDVVVQNLRPGLLQQFGLDGESLRHEKPALIYANIGAYGASGPLATLPGYDPLMQAFGGIMSVTGAEQQDPVRVGPAIIDQGSAMWSVIGILVALHARSTTGVGCEIGTSLYETAIGWLTTSVANLFATGVAPRRMGSGHASMVPYRAFAASDGWLVIAAGNDNLFRRLAPALGHPEWRDDPRFQSNPDRVSNRELLNGLVEGVVALESRDHWVGKLREVGVPCAPVLGLDEVVKNPQFEAVAMAQTHPESPIPLVGLPLQFDGHRPPFRNVAPQLGANSSEILAGRNGQSAK